MRKKKLRMHWEVSRDFRERLEIADFYLFATFEYSIFFITEELPFCSSFSEDADVTDAAKSEDTPGGPEGSTPDRPDTPEGPVAETSTVSEPARPATRPMAPRRLGGLKSMKPGPTGLNGPMVPQDWGGWKSQLLLLCEAVKQCCEWRLQKICVLYENKNVIYIYIYYIHMYIDR